jgi:hypothetical protein
MASEVVLRQWWVVVRRAGVITQRIQVRLLPDRRDPDVDPFVGPVFRDFDVLDPGVDVVDLSEADDSVLATGELIAATNAWEIQYVE